MSTPRHPADPRIALPFLLLVLVALAPVTAGAQALRYTRPLEVAEAGWVRVPLGPEMLRRTGTGGGLQLFGPDGEPLAFRRVAARSPPLRRAVEVAPPVATDGGWWVPLEVAPGPRLHERLLLEVEGAEAEPVSDRNPGVRIETTADGETWELLVAGRLRPVASTPGRYAVSYPATDVDRLRLFFPRDGRDQPPEIVRAAVAEVPPGSSRLSLARLECRAGTEWTSGARTVCRLPLGGAGHHLRHLCFLVTSTGPAGYRILDAEEGRWESVIEGVWGLPGEDVPRCVRLALDLTAGSAEAEALRLEVYAAGGSGEEGAAAPTVREASAELAPEELVFRARRAGLHTLAYGPAVLASAPTADVPRPGSIPPPEVTARVEPGPEEATEVPVEPITVPASTPTGAATTSWREVWPVAADTPEPGQLFRLSLPEVVYGVARSTGSGVPDLRLLRPEPGSGQSDAVADLPFAHWRPQTPELAAEAPGAAPRRRGETRRVTIEPPVRGLPLSALVVSVPASVARPSGEAAGEAGFRRRVRVLYVEPSGPAGDDDPDDEDGDGERGDDPDAEAELDDGSTRRVGPWVEWTCRFRPPLPCRATLALDGIPAWRVTLEIDDRGQAPLAAVDLELWRHRDVLLFPWPLAESDGTPRLAAGDEDPAAGRNGTNGGGDGGSETLVGPLDGQLASLLARPWQEARLVMEGEGSEVSGSLGKWTVALALLVALCTLLFLLHRILRSQAERRP